MTDHLSVLAELYGVQTAFVDAADVTREASPDALRAVLAALGAAVTDPAGAVREERARRHAEVLPPVVVVPAVGAQVVDVGLERSTHPRDCWLTLESEDGTSARTRLMAAIHRPLVSSNVEGRTVDRYEAQLATPLAMLPAGYHRLRLEGPGIDAESLVVVAPRCPVPARGWGAFFPLHAMRSSSDWGVGSYTMLREVRQWLGSLGASLVGTLPLYPAFLEGPVEISPYLPVTRLGWSELYVDPTVLPELEISEQARALLASPGLDEQLATARRQPLVDYPASMALVRKVLEPLSKAVFSRPSPRRAALEAFARERPDLVLYARFRAGEEVPGRGGTGPGPGLAPGPGPGLAPGPGPGLAPGPGPGLGARLAPGPGAIPDDDVARYHLYAQWVAEQQLASAGGGLFLDLPVGVHPDGFDTRLEPQAFVAGVEGGAPPDLFFSRGQRWGFRPLHPRGLREQRYRHVIAMLRHVMRHASALRLDHVMGLYRLYWVPAGADATDGAYVRYPDNELRAIVALEASRSGTAIVGEDLGTVPAEVREGMEHDRMLRSWVLQFEVSEDAPLPDPPELALASIGTHDLPRFATFWEAPERARWRRALGSDAQRGLRACLDHMAAGPARLVLADLEDLWLERWPHNRPGTGPEAGNWQHRAARTLEGIVADEGVVGSLERIDALRRQEETW